MSWGAVASAGGDIGSAALGAWASYEGARQAAEAQGATNVANLNIAREQMKFQKEMSDTAYQRRRRDLVKAGYNPLLAVGGPGATTPSGATAQMINPKKGRGELYAKAGRNFMQHLVGKAQVRNLEEQNRLLAADADVKEQQRDMHTSSAGKFAMGLRIAIQSGLGQAIGVGSGLFGAHKFSRMLTYTNRRRY